MTSLVVQLSIPQTSESMQTNHCELNCATSQHHQTAKSQQRKLIWSGTEYSVNVKSNYHYGHGAQSDNLKRMS